MGKITDPLLEGRPYSGAGDDSLPANVKALPDHAKAIWVATFNGAWSGWDSGKTDLDQEGYAMATAWAAVNKQYKKDADGNWSKRSVVEGPEGYLSKVWRTADGRARWRATVSDDGVDQYATRMTIDFQKEMATRAMAPGGMPWLGISHYDTFSAIGAPDRIYQQGRQLKAEGVFLTDSQDEFQAELARAAFERARAEASLLPSQRSIRTSIAFVPEAFDIEDCGVMAYTRGSLRHIALTTRPANSRADFTAEEDTMPRSKTLRGLRREDAAAIVGEDLAARLYQKEGDDEGARTTEFDGLVYRAALEEEEGDVMVSADGENWEPVLMRTRSGVPFAAAPLNDRATAWDAGKARQRVWDWATGADGAFDAAKARKAFAIYDSANAENKTAMSLPHHDIEGGSFVTQQRGVIACAAVCQGARGGFKEFQSGDTDAAKSHIGKHYAQMNMTAPWDANRANLRDRAEELWVVEAMPDLYEEGALLAATAALKADLDSGALPKPTLEEARAMFEDSQHFGGALLRATGATQIADALQMFTTEPGQEQHRAGRRVKGEVLTQMEQAVSALQSVLEWARENLPDDPPAKKETARAVQPDVAFGAALAERYMGEGGVAPDASLIATMNAEQVLEAAYQASWTLMDIICANLKADVAEVSFEQRLTNVQGALNEFAQIINQVLSQSAQRSLTGGEGIKPDGGEQGAITPPPGEPDAETLAVDETLDAIRALAHAEKPDVAEAQVLLDALGERLFPIVTRPAASAAGGTEALLAAVLERMESMERTMEEMRAGQTEPAPPDPASLAPRRTAAVLPPPRRAVRPLGITPQRSERRPCDPMPPRDFAHGAHLRTGFNPYE